MEFAYSDKVAGLQDKLEDFMDRHIYPNEAQHAREIETGDRWQPTALMEELKKKARLEGLWNLFLPHSPRGAGLSNLEYAPLCEIMGRAPMASEVFNCSAPDTGNMETLELYGTEAQKEQWLKPLLAGEIRSCFAMTEPAVASSDATNIESTILRDGDHYVINGRKWWTTGAPDPRCKIVIFMGKTDPANPDRHRQQSMILVPMDTPGVKVLRPLLGVRLRRRPARPRRGDVRQCPRAAREHPAGRRPRLRDRPGPARTGPHPPLHARHRPGRAGARGDVQAREVARGLRQAARRADGHAGAHRRGAHHDRAGAAARAQGRLHDGHGRQQGGPRRDRHDQGRRAEDAVERRRHGDPGAWRRRRLRRFRPGQGLCRWRARCACSTVRTRSIATRSAGWNCAKYN